MPALHWLVQFLVNAHVRGYVHACIVLCFIPLLRFAYFWGSFKFSFFFPCCFSMLWLALLERAVWPFILFRC